MTYREKLMAKIGENGVDMDGGKVFLSEYDGNTRGCPHHYFQTNQHCVEFESDCTRCWNSTCSEELKSEYAKLEDVLPYVNTNTIDHPDHYNAHSIEVIDFINDWDLNFNCGNVIKYVARSPFKGKQIEDLKKARNYIDFEIERLEKLN